MWIVIKGVENMRLEQMEDFFSRLNRGVFRGFAISLFSSQGSSLETHSILPPWMVLMRIMSRMSYLSLLISVSWHSTHD